MNASPTDAIGLLSHILGGFNVSQSRPLSTSERVTIGVTEVSSLVIGYKAIHKLTGSEFLSIIGALVIAHATVGIAAESILSDGKKTEASTVVTPKPETVSEPRRESPPPPTVAAAPARVARVIVNEESPRLATN